MADAAVKKRTSLSDLIKQSNPPSVTISLYLIGACLCLFAWALYERVYKAPPRYFQILNETTAQRIPALKRPNINTPSVLNWAVEAATAAYTLDFYNYPTTLQQVRPYFTPGGYENFKDSLKAAKLISNLVEKKLILSAVVTKPPVVLKEGPILGGAYAWQVQFPMLLTYQSQSSQLNTKAVATLLIVTVPTKESVKGIGIASFVVKGDK